MTLYFGELYVQFGPDPEGAGLFLDDQVEPAFLALEAVTAARSRLVGSVRGCGRCSPPSPLLVRNPAGETALHCTRPAPESSLHYTGSCQPLEPIIFRSLLADSEPHHCSRRPYARPALLLSNCSNASFAGEKAACVAWGARGAPARELISSPCGTRAPLTETLILALAAVTVSG